MSQNPPVIPRPGGRSARVQAAVHQATQALLAEHGREEITVPMIAARAGVTPSTIYRRWGELGDLLADVALERLRADVGPADTGSVAGDLHAWAEQYRDEMSSDVGMGMMLDVLSAARGGTTAPGRLPVPCQCAQIARTQIDAILARGVARGEPVPAVEAVMDLVVAPVVYRALYWPEPMDAARARALVDVCMQGVGRRQRTA